MHSYLVTVSWLFQFPLGFHCVLNLSRMLIAQGIMLAFLAALERNPQLHIAQVGAHALRGKGLRNHAK